MNLNLRTVGRFVKTNLRSRFNPDYQLNYRGTGQINFIDVGSVGGLPDPWRKNARLVKFLLNFEPNGESARQISSLTYNTAVWDSDAVLPFYIYKGFESTGSSLFEQNMEYVRTNYETLKLRGPAALAETWFARSALLKTIEMRCRILDGILFDELPDVSFHFLKIDAQGAEFNILNGAQTLLSGGCIGLHLELFTVPLYKGIALLDQVQEFLSQFGFELVKKFPAHGTFASQHDCLFLKSTGDLALLTLIKKVYEL